MVIAFGVYGFDQDNVKLQPWLTIHQVGMRLVNMGWEVHVITDLINNESTMDGIILHKVESLRQTNSLEVIELINEINPEKLILLSSPLNLVGAGWFNSVNCELYAFLSYPFYSKRELLKAMPHLIKKDVKSYARYLLLPNFIWKKTLNRYFTGLLAQSDRTVKRVANLLSGQLQQCYIPAGIDLDFWTLKKKEINKGKSSLHILYVGSAKTIRGFNVLLDAFSKTISPKVNLRILARGSTETEEAKLKKIIFERVGGKSENVTINGGWMDKESLRDEIQNADLVVLPFVLVPSELPVSVIECVACGTPVIATDINGLPEAVGKAGLIVEQGSVRSLIKAIDRLYESTELLKEITDQCEARRQTMLSWDEVSKQWEEALS